MLALAPGQLSIDSLRAQIVRYTLLGQQLDTLAFEQSLSEVIDRLREEFFIECPALNALGLVVMKLSSLVSTADEQLVRATRLGRACIVVGLGCAQTSYLHQHLLQAQRSLNIGDDLHLLSLCAPIETLNCWFR